MALCATRLSKVDVRESSLLLRDTQDLERTAKTLSEDGL